MCKRMLNWDYDPKRDIIFIFNFDEYDYQESIELNNMTVDLNPKRKAVALEIFGSARFLEIDPESLIDPEDFLIEIYGQNGIININASFNLNSEKGLISRILKEETGIEQEFINKSILRPKILRK